MGRHRLRPMQVDTVLVAGASRLIRAVARHCKTLNEADTVVPGLSLFMHPDVGVEEARALAGTPDPTCRLSCLWQSRATGCRSRLPFLAK
jgi:hypothetical protein